jgi:cell division septal protein FtsQ
MFKRKRRPYYPKNKYSNPFFRPKSKIKMGGTANFSKFWFIGGLIICGGIVWFFFFSAYFSIASIEVSGSGSTYSKDIEDLAWKQTEKRSIIFGRQKNLILFDESGFTNSLKGDYNFKSLVVEKKLPSKIIIKLEEKEHSLAWQEADNYYYINEDGEIIYSVDLLEINSKEVPVIENLGGPRISGKAVNIGKGDLLFIKNLFAEFKNNYKDVETDKFAVNDKTNFIILKLIKGPELYFDPKVDLKIQLNKFSALKQELKEEFFTKKYIDLTLGDRVSYK